MGKRFVEKVQGILGEDKVKLVDIVEFDYLNIEDAYYIIQTRCEGFGEIPELTEDFIESFVESFVGYLPNLVGTFVSGSKNWGKGYGRSAKTIEDNYGIKSLIVYEGSGFDKDVQKAVGLIKYILDYSGDAGNIYTNYIEFLHNSIELKGEDSVFYQELILGRLDDIKLGIVRGDIKPSKSLITNIKNLIIEIDKKELEDNYINKKTEELLKYIGEEFDDINK